MTDHPPHGADAPIHAHASNGPPRPVKVAGYLAAAWCLGFAGVNVWEIATGPDDRLAAYAPGLAVIGVLVLVLKLVGAAVALAAVTPGPPRVPVRVLAAALWGAFGLLGLYSAGNVVITAGTVSGLLEPSAAWIAAGGVTPMAVLYVLFFMAGAALFGVVAVWFHRRHRVYWSTAVAGLVSAPLLLTLILVVAPAVLGRLGLLPA